MTAVYNRCDLEGLAIVLKMLMPPIRSKMKREKAEIQKPKTKHEPITESEAMNTRCMNLII